MSGVHGHLSSCVKKFARDENKRSQRYYRILNEVPTVLMIGIVIALTGQSWMMDNFAFTFAGFILFWFINMFFVWRGTESIRVLETIAAPLLILLGLGGSAMAGGAQRPESSG